jgi:hypothetical protein
MGDVMSEESGADEKVAKADEYANKAYLYGKMADDLRAQAAKLRYVAKYGDKLNSPVSAPPATPTDL